MEKITKHIKITTDFNQKPCNLKGSRKALFLSMEREIPVSKELHMQ